jgi:hypothetical protein
MAIGDLYEMVTYVRTAERPMQFTFGYRMEAGTINPDSMPKAALKFSQDMLDTYILCCATGLEVDKVEMRPVTNTTDLIGGILFNNKVGTLIGDPLPNSSNPVIHLLTNAPNSKHNGRMFVPGCPEEANEDGDVSVVQQALLNTFGTGLLLDLIPDFGETAEYTPVVISRYLAGVKRTPPIGHTLVSAIARPFFRQQRKRGGKRLGLST